MTLYCMCCKIIFEFEKKNLNLIVLFHVLTHNRDSSVNRPISNCIMIADNKFKNRVHKFTAYAVFS